MIREYSHRRAVEGNKSNEQKTKRETADEDPSIRAENEDDDGYDPYSDRRSDSRMFEADPWN